MRTRKGNDWVHLALALTIIALVSMGMYSFASRAVAVGPLYNTTAAPGR